jgi:hypothetical protein
MSAKDFWRPIFGTVLLQPPTALWCYLTDIPYWSNLGIFTVIATIYLMPVYALYERWWNRPEEKPVGWPF